MNLRSAEGAKYGTIAENNSDDTASNIISRLQREEDVGRCHPGPMAQAFTFRAVGAPDPEFSPTRYREVVLTTFGVGCVIGTRDPPATARWY